MVGGCCVCADENGWTDNPLIYCDGENCEVAVHQGCYGIQEVPDGEWFCAKCTKAAVMAPGTVNSETFCCQLCPFDYGALKRTDRKDGWAHVICALYIPEVRFGNVHSMEPVILSDVPVDKFQKICYICNDERPSAAKKGACMSCNKNNCKRSFHVTCAQRKGLLCEEGAVSRNVKYCGYCESHLKKVINDPGIKVIPACPPIQRLVEKQEKQKKEKHSTSTVLLTPPPPPPPTVPKVTHMLADPIPIRPPPNQVNNSVLGLGSAINSVSLEDRSLPSSSTSSGIFANPPTAFSPPLTTSSRSSVAPDPTPPLSSTPKNNIASSGPLIPSTVKTSATTSSEKPMANGSTPPETTVGSHCLQQLHSAAAVASGVPPSEMNGYPGPSQLSSFMHEIPARNTTSVASLLPPNAADFHLNGGGMDEEKTVKAVLTAPLAKAKRMRDSKHDIIDKSHKRPRANGRPPAVLGSSSSSSGGTVGKSASMQRLINLVQPVVTEVVTDFQRDRVADRTAAERRAAVAQSQPSTSTNGLSPTVAPPPPPQNLPPIESVMSSTNPPPPPHQNNGIPQNVAAPPPPQSQMPGPSTSTGEQLPVPVTSNGSCQTQHMRLNTIPSFMEQLLERQWDQGSSLFLSNASFDVAQLMSCLFQLKSENIRLEENLTTLRRRRDHLFALNSRLAEVNTQDLAARKREAAQLPDLPVVPKAEVLNQDLPSKPHPVQANHSSVLFEEIKPPAKSHKKAVPAAAHPPAPAPTTIAHPVPISTPAPLSTASTPAPGITMANAGIQNHRATPSTAGASLSSTPMLSAANELAALSPDRVANHTHALLNMYARNAMPGAMDATSVAAQLSMISSIQQQVNSQALFSRMLQNPGLAGISAMLNGGIQPTAQTLAAIPSTSATPNGK